jgi:hypothetical protein
LKPFKYPGRESKTVEEFLRIRPEVRDMYIYDVLLSSGEMLYSCAGGMGLTEEKYIVDMHKFVSRPTFVSAVQSAVPTPYTRRRYHALREKFNERSSRITSWSHCSELYCLWAGSGFSQRYRDHGYEGAYMPTRIDYDQLAACSSISREKRLLFRKEGPSKFSETIITDRTVVYAHLPCEFGRYGAGFIWNESTLGSFARILSELSELGHKVCISAQYEKRGRTLRDYPEIFPSFSNIVIPQFKGSKLTFESKNSEIYLFNF